MQLKLDDQVNKIFCDIFTQNGRIIHNMNLLLRDVGIIFVISSELLGSGDGLYLP
jgi:hypothetical protein